MGYKQLFIFVEGDTDKRFFESIYNNTRISSYNNIQFILYSRMSNKKINSYIKSILSQGSDLVFFADLDEQPCSDEKLNTLCNTFNIGCEEQIFLVINEIECWYLAGMNDEFKKQHKIKDFSYTDCLNKEKFIEIIPNSFSTSLDFMISILKNFEISNALKFNKSFRKYYDEHLVHFLNEN